MHVPLPFRRSRRPRRPAPPAGSPTAVEETLLGCAAAIGLGHLLWPRAASKRLASASASAMAAIDRVLSGPEQVGAARRLEERLLGLHDVAMSARGELFGVPDIDERLERSRQVEDLGWMVLGAVADRDDDLLAAVRSSTGPPSPA